jgi:hypothetical protein
MEWLVDRGRPPDIAGSGPADSDSEPFDHDYRPGREYLLTESELAQLGQYVSARWGVPVLAQEAEQSRPFLWTDHNQISWPLYKESGYPLPFKVFGECDLAETGRCVVKAEDVKFLRDALAALGLASNVSDEQLEAAVERARPNPGA